ncbi:MAG: cytochrome C [Candidatus Zixiibacteriota bacterium]|nr:MAG: cytochrome C [candidate division Zixibacteria bacterium]
MFAGLTGKIISVLAQAPVPRDLDLPLPIPAADLKILLVITFLAHILFVNLMVGSSVLTVIFEVIGLSSPRYDALAKRIAHTITVNKSLAVVLGVGPLLCISLVYTIHFYSANALTGYAWISVIPLVILAFLAAYLHKYTWDKWTGRYKRMHVGVGLTAAVLFLCIPLIFLSNINLMLFPQQWVEVKGFFSSLRVGNVFPRLFHFLAASIAVTGLFLAGWFGRKSYPLGDNLPEFNHSKLRRLFYRVAFYVTLAQLFFGPLLLFTLPAEGVTGTLLWLILTGAAIAIAFLYLLSREIQADDHAIGNKYVWTVIVFTLVVVAMGTGRHLYRESSLSAHMKLIEDRSDTFHAVELATHMRIDAGLGVGDALGGGPTGESVFRNCAACHAVDRVLAAPSLIEIQSIYKGNPDGIIEWAKAPGKKRPEFAPMPAFAHLDDERLRLVADYMLSATASPDKDEASSEHN